MAPSCSEIVSIDSLLAHANQLKPLPSTTTKLVMLISGGQYDIQQVAEIVAFDPSLTMKLLRAANSAAFGGAIPLSTAREAVLRLGAAQVLTIATTSSVGPVLDRVLKEYGYAEGELWKHSVLAAIAAESIAVVSRVPIPAETFTAAILHDVGKLVIARFLSPPLLQILQSAEIHGRMSRVQAELEVLQVHHGEIGGIVAQHWKLPEGIVQGIIHHHTPELIDQVVPQVVYLANLIAKAVQAGMNSQSVELPPSQFVLDRLGISFSDLDRLKTDVAQRFEKVSSVYASG